MQKGQTTSSDWILLALAIAGAVLVVAFCTRCAPLTEAAAVPLPIVQAQEAISAPSLPLDVNAPLIWRDHALERHGWDAVRAREAVRNGEPHCQHFLCHVDLLVICPERDGYVAIQWRWADTASGRWVEGTSYIADVKRAERLVARNECRPVD